jgi:hypothetical protein
MKRAIIITGIVFSFVAGCLIDDPEIDTDEAGLAAPDAGAPPSLDEHTDFCRIYPTWCEPRPPTIPPPPSLPPRTPCTILDPCTPPVAPDGPVTNVDNDWDFCRIYPRWCDDEPSPPTIPPPPSSPDPGPYPCHLYPPGQCPADPSKPPVAPDTKAAAADVPVENIGGGECLPEEAEAGRCNGGGGGTGGGNGPQPGDRCTRPVGQPPAGPYGEVCTYDRNLRCVCFALPAPPFAPDVDESTN